MNINDNLSLYQLQIITESFTNGTVLGFDKVQKKKEEFSPSFKERSFHSFKDIKNINSKDYEFGNIVFLRIADFITNHKDQCAKSELEKLQGILDNKISAIKAETAGIGGFFRYFFTPGLKQDQKEKMGYLEGLKRVVNGVVKEKAEKREKKGEKLQDNHKEELKPLPVISQPLKTVSKSEPEPESESEISVLPPPPPPPPQGIFSNLLGAIHSTLPLTAEQKHNENQKRILERNLKERANPLNFYEVSRPKNERELEQLQAQFEADIVKFNTIKSFVSEEMKKQIDGWIAEKQKNLTSIAEQLKGTTKAVKGLQEGQLTSEFLCKVQKLTNEEIKFVLLQFLDGKVPSDLSSKEGDADLRDVLKYRYYLANKEFFDEILPEWEALSASESGKAFASYKEGWNNYLNGGVISFIQVLSKRKLPAKSIDHLKTPDYQAISFQEANQKKVKNSKERDKANAVSSGQLDLAAIQRGVKLRSREEQKPLTKKNHNGPQTVLDEIKQRMKRIN